MSNGARNSSLGSYGERVAAQRLVAEGMVLVDRNWRCELGELDLVLRDGEVLVACEVKTRSGAGFGSPQEAVVPAKVQRLHTLLWRWCEEHGIRPQETRVDVVGVLRPRRGGASLDHMRGVS